MIQGPLIGVSTSSVFENQLIVVKISQKFVNKFADVLLVEPYWLLADPVQPTQV